MGAEFGGGGVPGLEVAERPQLLLERLRALQVVGAGGGTVVGRIAEVGIDERPAGRLELPDGGRELLFGVAADLAAVEHHENVALADFAVVLVLQPGLRQHVEEVFPDGEVEENALGDPEPVLAVDGDLELAAMVGEFRRRGEEDLPDGGPGGRHVAGSGGVKSAKPYTARR
ncbi:MAG: hypothetical protein AW07_04581 [Candidatus Accumulibacter sp. SK-11]|nr:MAG: hypothetical protein AW07_04581 [Candidatus Accumulibacter sp. SK-11]